MTSDANDKLARLNDFVRRIEAGEFDGGDKFHRFVVKEIYPLLTGGTFTSKDLEYLARRWSRHAVPVEHGLGGMEGDRKPKTG